MPWPSCFARSRCVASRPPQQESLRQALCHAGVKPLYILQYMSSTCLPKCGQSKVESSHHGTRTTSLFRAPRSPYLQLFFFHQQPPCIPTDIIVLRNKVAVFSARDRHTRHVCDRHLQGCIADPGSRVPPTWFATSQRILSLISGAGLELDNYGSRRRTLYGILQFV